ncbi:MAG: ComEC/Rec2 family competence protein [Natronincolaceae bacterium]|nr:ComEC/Rec2 family competence protein [Bacillota bacterium]NLK90187.1 ComEC/Rec2 family competence protein [Clostridiales bacterium]
MKRPFVTLCIFLFIGIMIAHLFDYSVSMYCVIFFVLLTLISFLIYEGAFNALLMFTVIFLGIYLYGQSITGSGLPEVLTPDSIIKVKILKEASHKRGYNEHEVEIINIFADEKSRGIRINRKAQLNIYQGPEGDSIFTVGDIIEIRNVSVKELSGNHKKDAINGYELFLKSKGLEYILNANTKDITKTDINFKYIDILGSSHRVKVYLEDFLDSTLDFENSGILKSIVFGNQGYLSRDKLDMFSKTGTAHIMAVSGLHVGLMAIVADKFLRLINIGKNKRLYLTMIILIFYGYMVYFPASIVRAGVMYLLYITAYFLHKRYDSVNALFFIGFMLLIRRPLIVHSISFQLSFMATLSILLLGPILNKRLDKIIGQLSPLVSVTLAAQIGTFPIMAYHFNQISLVSLVTNLLIVPMMSPMLSITFVSVLVGTISFRLGFLINRITDHLLNYINWVTVKCAIIPYGSLKVDEIKPAYIFSYYVILAIIYFLLCKKSDLQEERPVKAYEL